jgi:signal transduction histidine kinase
MGPSQGCSAPSVASRVSDVAERAEELQGHLLGLQRASAFAAVTAASTAFAEWTFPGVLQAIVDATRDLLGARYVELGVVGYDERVEQFVRSGDARRGGDAGLGTLAGQPAILGLDKLGLHPPRPGSSPADPGTSASLGVAIQVGGEVFGGLFLSEPIDRLEFTSEDEVLASVMAVTAGGTIANARRLAETEQRGRWLTAAGALTHPLLAGETDPLELITNVAVIAAEADVVLMTRPEADGTVSSRMVNGPLAATLKVSNWPGAATLADQVLRDGKPVLVNSYPAQPIFGFDIGPAMVVPLAAGGQVRGALSFYRAAGGRAFTPAEVDMAATFANQAALAMELMDSRADHVRLAVLESRERIAEDLHDHVIQELFATGMSLQALTGRLDRPELIRRRLGSAVASLDNVISRIRTAIFELRPQVGRSDGADLKAAVLAVSTEHTPQLGYSPHVQFSGLFDSAIAMELSDDIVAVTREALSNCARHAGATTVTVSLEAAGDLLTLGVADNGRGIGQPHRFSGLSNMRQRAQRHHGTCNITSLDAGGTQLTWSAHISR